MRKLNKQWMTSCKILSVTAALWALASPSRANIINVTASFSETSGGSNMATVNATFTGIPEANNFYGLPNLTSATAIISINGSVFETLSFSALQVFGYSTYQRAFFDAEFSSGATTLLLGSSVASYLSIGSDTYMGFITGPTVTVSPITVPEPASIVLLGAALLATIRRRTGSDAPQLL